jgi:hypothetical protein
MGSSPERLTCHAPGTDLLAEGIVARMLAGLPTRRYAAGLEPVGRHVDVQASGTSNPAVSRRFVAATAERLAGLLARRLDDRRWLIVFLDGFGMGEHLGVGALGVTDDGTKVPLGVAEGTTENKAVCTRLVADLAERGLDASGGVLFVVDGGKALERAIRAVFGAKALIQRCRRHRAHRRITWPGRVRSPRHPAAGMAKFLAGKPTRNATSPTTCPRPSGPWCSGGCAPPGRSPSRPAPSWSSWPAASTASGPVPPPRCARGWPRP